MSQRTALPAWQALQAHAAELERAHLRDLFDADAARFDALHVESLDLLFDYSRQRLTRRTLDAPRRARARLPARGTDRGAVRRGAGQRDRASCRHAHGAAQPLRTADAGRGPRRHAGGARRARTDAGVRHRRYTKAASPATAAPATPTSSTSASAAPTSASSWPPRHSADIGTARSACTASPTSTAQGSPKCSSRSIRARRCSSSARRPSRRRKH